MEYKDILYAVRENVARIIINRPKKYNAFRTHTLKEFVKTLEDSDLVDYGQSSYIDWSG